MISISVVSHGHAALIASLLADLAHCTQDGIEVIVTMNIPETLEPGSESMPFPLEIIRNEAPQGFGANHNASFRRARGEYFCVLNPDIRIGESPFPVLVDVAQDPRIAVVAPLVFGPDGQIEDSARRFPTPGILFRKLLGLHVKREYSLAAPVVHPDWVAGMFMFFRRDTFSALNGFDERYYLYYEDVDLCSRARKQGLEIALVTRASVTHDARRTSRRNLRYMLWHARSALRFLTTS